MSEHMTNQSDDSESLEFPAKVKLDALDPRDFDGAVRSITAGAAAARARLAPRDARDARDGGAGALAAIAQWSAPAFAAAAVVVLAAGAALTLLPTPAVAAQVSFAETAGIPPTLVLWSSGDHSPTPEELLGAISVPTPRTTP
jgi:hypothetical protein